MTVANEEQKKVAEALPFAAERGGAMAGFRSDTKLPKGANAKAVKRAVDRIVRDGDSKRVRDQATALLFPVEREFVDQVLTEFRAWAAARAQGNRS
jgi:hypothetical protein